MLQRLCHSVLRQLLEDIQSHQYCAIIVDETTDIKRVEQLSLCIRHVDDEFNIMDDFIGLYAIPKNWCSNNNLSYNGWFVSAKLASDKYASSVLWWC